MDYTVPTTTMNLKEWGAFPKGLSSSIWLWCGQDVIEKEVQLESESFLLFVVK